MNFDDLINDTLNTEDIVEEGLGKALATGALGLGLALGTPSSSQAEPAPTEQQEQVVDLDKLLDTLQQIESNNNPKAVGDDGKALGILQIWQGVVDDVNRVYKTNFTHKDAFNPVKARKIARLYLIYWGRNYMKNEKKPASYEVLARIWNGGPKGYKKSRTDPYWAKVQKAL